jgi:hypothetical protein
MQASITGLISFNVSMPLVMLLMWLRQYVS